MPAQNTRIPPAVCLSSELTMPWRAVSGASNKKTNNIITEENQLAQEPNAIPLAGRISEIYNHLFDNC